VVRSLQLQRHNFIIVHKVTNEDNKCVISCNWNVLTHLSPLAALAAYWNMLTRTAHFNSLIISVIVTFEGKKRLVISNSGECLITRRSEACKAVLYLRRPCNFFSCIWLSQKLRAVLWINRSFENHTFIQRFPWNLQLSYYRGCNSIASINSEIKAQV
jgi:hypothetical protein